MRATSIATFLITLLAGNTAWSESIIIQSPYDISAQVKCGGTTTCNAFERCAMFSTTHLKTITKTVTTHTLVAAVETQTQIQVQCQSLGYECCGRMCREDRLCVNCHCQMGP